MACYNRPIIQRTNRGVQVLANSQIFANLYLKFANLSWKNLTYFYIENILFYQDCD